MLISSKLKKKFEKGAFDEDLETYVNQLAAQGSVCEIPDAVQNNIGVMDAPYIDLNPYSEYISRHKKHRSRSEVSKMSISPRKNGLIRTQKSFHLQSLKSMEEKQSIVVGESLSNESDVKTIGSISSGHVSDESDEFDSDSEVESNDSDLNYSDVCPVENYDLDFEEIVWDDRLQVYLEVSKLI